MWKAVSAVFCSLSLSGCIYVSVRDLEGDFRSEECNQAAYLVQSGTVRDPRALAGYRDAFAGSLRDYEYSARLVNDQEPSVIYAGAQEVSQAALIARFACIEGARGFWRSQENQRLDGLREQAGSFNVAVYPAVAD